MLGYSEADLIGKKTDIIYESQEEFDRVGSIIYGGEKRKTVNLS